jgi:hypothetical protein
MWRQSLTVTGGVSGMWGRFPLTRVVIRVLEIAGAGLTSALVAYLLGRADTPPPAPPLGVVQLAPTDEEMIRPLAGAVVDGIAPNLGQRDWSGCVARNMGARPRSARGIMSFGS